MFKKLLMNMFEPIIEEKVKEKLNELLKGKPLDYINIRKLTFDTSSTNNSGSWESFYNIVPLASKHNFKLSIDFKTISKENVNYNIWDRERIECKDFADLNELIKNIYNKNLFLDNYAFKDFNIILSFKYNEEPKFYYWYPITNSIDTGSIYDMKDFKDVLKSVMNKLEDCPELKLI